MKIVFTGAGGLEYFFFFVYFTAPCDKMIGSHVPGFTINNLYIGEEKIPVEKNGM
jgi:hypothetical protein